MAVSEAREAETITRDPVCGMTVDPGAGKPFADHDGHRHHFCAERCRERFLAEPEAFIEAEDPVCGMALEPMTPSADAGPPSPELVDPT